MVEDINLKIETRFRLLISRDEIQGRPMTSCRFFFGLIQLVSCVFQLYELQPTQGQWQKSLKHAVDRGPKHLDLC